MITEGEIQNSLYYHCMGKQHLFAIPNVYMYGMNESDLLSVSRSGYTQEFEIKISRADFKADFKKNRHLHYQRVNYDRGPAYFSYVAPEGIIEIKDLPEYAGLLHYKDGFVTVVRSPKRFMDSKKLTLKQCLSLCGKLSFRYWDYRKEQPK